MLAPAVMGSRSEAKKIQGFRASIWRKAGEIASVATTGIVPVFRAAPFLAFS
jgi:hypothetical protein